jgi:PleD family two-component response regulator
MMAETQCILVVEDDIDTAEMLSAYFEAQGYDVLTAAWGEDALRLTQDVLPDLVVLDIHLPDIDGYQVCRRLRKQRRTEQVPIIFLTERSERIDRLTGLELGAVDYITKPFDIQELRLRVRNALRRASLGTLVNPITGLPTDALIDERLTALLRRKDWALLSVGIHGLRDFSDSYGFVASDDVLRAVALMMRNVAQELGDSDPFIGHLGEADFIITSTPSEVDVLRERIVTRTTQAIDHFYSPKDREEKQGQVPKISLGTGVVNPQDAPLKSPLDVKVAALNAQTFV